MRRPHLHRQAQGLQLGPDDGGVADHHPDKLRLAQPKKPKSAREGQARASIVFRDFVRQLEKLDVRPAKPAREAQR